MLTVRNVIIAACVATVLLLVALGWLQYSRSKATQARVDAAQTSAVVESAKDAIATQGAASGREQASEALTQKNSEEIRNAEGANVKAGAGVNDAGLRSLCRRSAYRDSERCRLLAAGSE